ncbi:hypothetical protein EGM71_00215 [Stenotrophomonas maltophilia]|nr:hypothetical protein EGM71_00215 [Stenotrophomonas maltophilia]
MDGATEATWTYLRRPPQPDPPRHPTECPLLTLTLTLTSAGAGLQALQTQPLLSTASAPVRRPAAGCTGTARFR